MLGRDWGKNSENSSKMYHESKDFFGAPAFLIMTDFRVRSLGKCLYFPLDRRRRKVFPQRYSTLILQSQTCVRLRRHRRPAVRDGHKGPGDKKFLH